MVIQILLAVIILLGIVFFVSGNFFYDYALKRSKKDYLKVFSDIQNAAPNEKEKDALKKWVDSLSLEECWETAFDGIPLYAVIGKQPSYSGKWVICVHGYYNSSKHMYKFAKRFYENGYNFLLPDCRGHGKSGGDYVGMGWNDRLDVEKWISRIISIDPKAEIVLYGVSMGASAVMMTAGEDLPGNVKCVVEDCGFTSAREQFEYIFKKEFKKIPKLCFIDIANFFCKKRAGYDIDDASALKQVEKSKVPILFIHGTGDRFVPSRMVYELYDVAKCDKDILVVEDAGHIKAAEVAKDKYWDKLWSFTEKYV